MSLTLCTRKPFFLLSSLVNYCLILLFIQELYKTTEELEEKKADKHMVESEIVSGFILAL